jgi:Phosphodiester glycosidase
MPFAVLTSARRIAPAALLAGLVFGIPVLAGARDIPRYKLVVAPEPVGPGTVLMRIREGGPGGPIDALVLRVDLADPAVRAGLLYPGRVAGVATLSAMAQSAGAFAAVNGDFFNIGETGAPVGPMVTGDRLIKGPQPGRGLAAGVGEDGVGRISTVALSGFADLPSGRVPLADLNDANPGYAPMLAPNGIGLFTPAWGTYSRSGAVRGLPSVTEVLVRRGLVARVSRQAGAGPIPPGAFVLLGAGSGGRRLAQLRVGQSVSVQYAQRTPAPAPFRFALGGKYRLLRAGVVQGGLPVAAGAQRTAVGFSDGGLTMWLVVTESHEVGVTGLDLPELAVFMRGLGVRDAVNLDDGGSTTIVSRLPARSNLALLNRPGDGSERQVANGIGLFAQK